MRHICTSIVAALMLAATSATFAASIECTPQQIDKLTADDGAIYDCFGSSVSIDAGVAVIGAQRTDVPDSNPGSAYVYEQQGDGTWQQIAKLTADDGASYDFFGWSVALDAGVAVIGAYGDDDNGSDSGSAYVFEQQADGTWQQIAKLTADDGASDDFFGWSVALDAGVAVIGAYGDYDNGSSCGSAYVYEQQADGTWQQTAKLTADDGASYDNFGHSVATSGGVAVIGAYGDDDNGPRSGSAYVYEQQADGTWQQIAKLTAGASNDFFGWSVALDAGVAVIGAHYDDDNGNDSGSAYVFEQQADGAWQQTAKLTADDGAAGDWFGYSVATSGGVAVIGAHYDDDNGNDSGSAYAFEQQADGAWQQTAKLTADDGAAEDKFGYSVATSGGVSVIGSKDDDGDNGGYSFGSAYVYNYLSVIDCNDNGVSDVCDLTDGTSFDCDQNGVPDECQPDCDGDGWIDACDNDADVDGDGIPDNCETDCNGNTVPDHFEIEMGWAEDCDGNLIPDDCDIANDPSLDCDGSGVLDSCEIENDQSLDCNGNGTLDACDLIGKSARATATVTITDFVELNTGDKANLIATDGTNYDFVCGENDSTLGTWEATDSNNQTAANLANVINSSSGPAGTEFTAAVDGATVTITQATEGADGNTTVTLTDSGAVGMSKTNFTGGRLLSEDCNANGVLDECDIDGGGSNDVNGNGIPDECEGDCNENGVPDHWDIKTGASEDCNANGIPDDCDTADGTSNDVNDNSIPDECEEDCNGNGSPDDWDLVTGWSEDCNENLIPDECDLAAGTSEDCNTNGIPDECDIADETSEDINGDGVPDECQCLADIDGSGAVTIDDLLAVIGYWGSSVPAGDLNFDGTVDIEDLLILFDEWGPCP